MKRGEFHLEAKVSVQGTLNVSGDRDTGWTVEGRIPWTDLNSTGGRPAPGETWRVNLARVDGAAPASELSSAAPLTRPSFHRTAEYAPCGSSGQIRSRVSAGRIRGCSARPTARKVFAPCAPGRSWRPARWSASRRRPMANGSGSSNRKAAAKAGCACGGLSARGDGSDAETLLELDDLAYNVAFHPALCRKRICFSRRERARGDAAALSRVTRYTVRDGRPDPGSRRRDRVAE